ncbi:hypothetical protein VA596_21505 [Amycolatopsis sp., V23-08]|uniref:Uncharacterized protein n=1 Tax=Amycolatopsis heterodermiae TaxID=3110235 RepID=A0ABU5R7D5_9PSEU|nr:hypothetical protein [Amycolatopsis sp., V23-08]MEA5362126.1 hypothetical protein [Amycolatopsis sp., V23-08]
MNPTPAVLAAFAGAVLTVGTYWLVESAGPAGWEEAVVESADRAQSSLSTEPGAGDDEQHHFVLRTASGERFDVRGRGRKLVQSEGTWLQVEISDVGREAQAIKVYGTRISVDSGGFGVFWAAGIGGGLLLGAVASCADAKRPIPAVASVVAGLGAGALPVLLLF